jgi:hypothetical protein
MNLHWRMSCDDSKRKKANAEYAAALRQVGVPIKQREFAFFFWEVFHDSEIEVRRVDLCNRVVTLALRNVFAIDRVTHFQSERGLRCSVDRRRFITEIDFRGVQELRIRYGQNREPLYHHSRLGKRGELFTLEIFGPDSLRASIVSMCFTRMKVSDISGAIKRYIGGSHASRFVEP